MAEDGTEGFNPRRAALRYAGNVEARAERLGDARMEPGMFQLVGEAVNAVVCGLVYVGDQLARQNVLLPVLTRIVDGEQSDELAAALNDALGRRG